MDVHNGHDQINLTNFGLANFAELANVISGTNGVSVFDIGNGDRIESVGVFVVSPIQKDPNSSPGLLFKRRPVNLTLAGGMHDQGPSQIAANIARLNARESAKGTKPAFLR